MPDLLIELFSEEIPARMQARAAADLKRLVTDGLVEAGLSYASAGAFHTPRRLALAVEGLLAESPATPEERKGPRVDAPEQALAGFLRSTGLEREQLEARDAGKGQVWFAVIERPGRRAEEIAGEVLETAIRSFPWPKSMRWGAGSLRWVRPLHSILAILSEEGEAQVVDVEIDGIRAGDRTRGHRFMAPDAFAVTSFGDYSAKLAAAHVVLSAEDRAERIWHDATQLAFAQGLDVVEDKGLLAEVAGLVEWPAVLMGEIGEEFLDLPPEVLRTSMKEHQKFFSVKDKNGRITRFVTVANRETADHGATILAGNQKVLSARLSDAKFFWENDLRVAEAGMGDWIAALENVTFERRLSSQADRVARIAALAREIAPVVGADAEKAEQAARIAKADLTSEMVYEFPELQGIMGEYYARAAGYGEDVAAVAREHYRPLGPSDDVPTAPLSVAVALADKIDTLTGFWAIGDTPTGSKDPFALRRAALGSIRITLDNNLRLQIKEVIDAALARNFSASIEIPPQKFVLLSRWWDLFRPESLSLIGERRSDTPAGTAPGFSAEEIEEIWAVAEHEGLPRRYLEEASSDLLSFLHDRLKVFLRDEGIRHDVIDACLAMPNADDLTLLVQRGWALQTFLAIGEGQDLLQGFKRAHNILRQAEEKDGVEYSFGPDPKLAETSQERILFFALDEAETDISSALKEENFEAVMQALANLRGPIDAFFEAVQVNCENQIVRRNRLNLLHRISAACLNVADLTRIEG